MEAEYHSQPNMPRKEPKVNNIPKVMIRLIFKNTFSIGCNKNVNDENTFKELITTLFLVLVQVMYAQ